MPPDSCPTDCEPHIMLVTCYNNRLVMMYQIEKDKAAITKKRQV